MRLCFFIERAGNWLYSAKGTKTRQGIIWVTGAAIFIVMAMSLENAFADEGKGRGKEVSELASSFDIPEKEIWKYRALGAEVKAITFESTKAIEQRNLQMEALLNQWKERHGIKDLRFWRVDTERNRIFRINKAPAEND